MIPVSSKVPLLLPFQDCEVEISDLKNAVSGKEAEVAAAEERCTHLVRLGEQRNQEIKTLQAQLVGVQARHVQTTALRFDHRPVEKFFA